MQDSPITCPECHHKFSLSGELKKELEAENEKRLKSQILDLQKKQEVALMAKEKELESKKQEMWAIAQQKAEEKIGKESALKVKDLEEQNKENKQKLEEAGKKELEFLKKEREFETKQKNLDIELQRKLNEQSVQIEEKAKKEAEEANRMKVKEYQKQNEMMQKQIEDLKRKAEQGSMQIQGEVQENDLRSLLQQSFPSDVIADVPTGIRGADLVQTVRNNFAQKSGIILWESKNTKAWSADWLKKLKDDQAEIQADLCILVSRTLPDDVTDFAYRDGVWVVGYEYALSLVSTLRFHLIEINKVKMSIEGRDEKMEVLYNYLSGPQFKNRVENIVSAFNGMKTDLDSEKRAMQRIWNKREKEIERVVVNTTGFYGDLQGIIGNSLVTIDQLELPEADDEDGLTLL